MHLLYTAHDPAITANNAIMLPVHNNFNCSLHCSMILPVLFGLCLNKFMQIGQKNM